MENARVLIVDDDEMILKALERILRRDGHTIVAAQNEDQALQLLESAAVVISDQLMPDTVGTEFLAKVRDISPDTVRILLTGHAEVEAAIEAINRGQVFRFLTKPWKEDEIREVVRQGVRQYELITAEKRAQELVIQHNKDLEQKVRQRTEQLLTMLERLQQSFQDIIQLASSIMDLQNMSAGQHARRVTQHSIAVGQKLGLSDEQLRHLETAALLHDIGKVGLPEKFFEKTSYLWTVEDWEQWYRIPIQGQAILQTVENLRDVGTTIRSIRERIDGRGKPDGLMGDQIPIAARIIAVANEYDHLINGTAGRPKHTSIEAQRKLEMSGGNLFDPIIVKTLNEYLHSVSHQRLQFKDQPVLIDDLRPGMMLATHVTTKRGLLLVPQGEILSYKTIDKIRNYDLYDQLKAEIRVYTSSLITNGESPST